MNLDFDRLSGQISSALEYAGGSYSLEDIRRGVDDGSFQLWPGTASVIITQVQQYPQRRLLCCLLAAGLLTELQQMLPIVLDYGRAQGCTSAFLVGRQGWARSFLATTGWRPSALVMETTL